jgi:hypothetical protein
MAMADGYAARTRTLALLNCLSMYVEPVLALCVFWAVPDDRGRELG